MKVFYIEHSGMYLGGHSVVVAETEDEARILMMEKLIQEDHGIEIFEIQELNVKEKGVTYLWNGDY